jgi:hypothetical protein
LEEKAIHDMGLGQSGTIATQQYSQRLQTAITVFVCPSRRACTPWPIAAPYAYVQTPKPYGDVSTVARSDYAINGGTTEVISVAGPNDLQQGDDPTYWANGPNPVRYTGISHLRLGATLSSIVDGATKTYLVGEKHVPVDAYETGTSPGDNESMYSGYCTDLHRFAGNGANQVIGQSPLALPLKDNEKPSGNIQEYVRFGSAHAAGFNMASCDGSVQHLGFDIDGELHFRSGHRKDEGRSLQSLR